MSRKIIGTVFLTLMILLTPSCAKNHAPALSSSTFEDLIKNRDRYSEKNELRRYTQGVVILARRGYFVATYPAVVNDGELRNEDDFIMIRDDALTDNLTVGDIVSTVGQLEYLVMDYDKKKIIYYLGSNEKSVMEGQRLKVDGNFSERFALRFQELAGNLYYVEPLREAQQKKEREDDGFFLIRRDGISIFIPRSKE